MAKEPREKPDDKFPEWTPQPRDSEEEIARRVAEKQRQKLEAIKVKKRPGKETSSSTSD